VWENVPVSSLSRTCRVIIAAWISLITLAISYAMIYEATNVATLWKGNINNINCASYTTIVSRDYEVYKYGADDSSTITYLDVLKDQNPVFYNFTSPTDGLGSYGYLQCYCKAVLLESQKNDPKNDAVAAMKAYKFYDGPSNSYQTYCNEQSGGSVLSTALGYIATFVIVLVNTNLSVIMDLCVAFERHNTFTGRVISKVTKLFIAQYINTAILSLIIAGDISLAGGKNIHLGGYGPIQFGIFTGTVQDYDSVWYYTVGASLLFTMFMFTLGNLPGVFVGMLIKKIVRVWDRRVSLCSYKKGTTHCDVQAQVDELYIGDEFPIEDKYAAILTLVFVDMTYSATMPLFYWITLLNLALIYCSDKLTLLNFYKRPPVLNAALPNYVTKVLFISAMFHVCNGMWMWGNNAFSTPVWSTSYTPFTGSNGYSFIDADHRFEFPIVWSDRITGENSRFLFFIFLFLLVILSFFLIKWVLFDVLCLGVLYRFLRKYNYNIETPVAKVEGNDKYFNAIPEQVIKTRLAEHTLKDVVHEIYKDLLLGPKDEEEGGEGGEGEKSKKVVEGVEQGDVQGTITDERPVEEAVGAPAAAAPAVKDGAPVASAQPHCCSKICGLQHTPVGEDEEEEGESELFKLLGHESYDLNTIPAYTKQFGTQSQHLARAFTDENCEVNDWLVVKARLKLATPDSEEMTELLQSCAPKRVRKMVKNSEGKEEEKMVIPIHTLLVDSLLGLFGGKGGDCFNSCQGCECLAEPDDEGVQPKWNAPHKKIDQIEMTQISTRPSEEKEAAPPAAGAAAVVVAGGGGELSLPTSASGELQEAVPVVAKKEEGPTLAPAEVAKKEEKGEPTPAPVDVQEAIPAATKKDEGSPPVSAEVAIPAAAKKEEGKGETTPSSPSPTASSTPPVPPAASTTDKKDADAAPVVIAPEEADK